MWENFKKNKFKQQIFEDLVIEREVDIRRKVNSIYNKTEEDFPDLKEFNKYLEEVEDIVFKLSNGIDVEQTEAELNKYELEHKLEILERNMRESQKNDDLTKYREAMERLKQEKLKIQKQMEIEDLEYQKQQQQELLDKMTNSSSSSEELIKQQQNQMLKRSSLRRKQLQSINIQLDQQFNQSNPFHKQLAEDILAVPFTPFQGDRDLNKNILYYLYLMKLTRSWILRIILVIVISILILTNWPKIRHTLVVDGDYVMSLNRH